MLGSFRLTVPHVEQTKHKTTKKLEINKIQTKKQANKPHQTKPNKQQKKPNKLNKKLMILYYEMPELT